jgi:hypothetical protein
MARRLTTNQEIAGSIPASLKMVDFFAFLSGGKSFLFFFSFFLFFGHKFFAPRKNGSSFTHNRNQRKEVKLYR